jgi:acyl transferase domain-containing protein
MRNFDTVLDGRKPVIFMFSGQGSHYYHMGESLLNNDPVFRHTLLELDEIAKQHLGESVVEKIYDPKRDRMDAFENTLYSHPGIFMVEYALAQVLMSRKVLPDLVLYTSMGAFAAAAIAGALTAEEALKAVIKQAELLIRHCETGKMLAIIDDPAIYNRHSEIHDNCFMAGVNFDRHFVVAADLAGLKAVEQFLARDITYQRLAVSIPFHAPLIDPSKLHFLNYMQQQNILPARIPMICCMNASITTQLPSFYFWQVIREPIQFMDTIAALESKGSYQYIDVGPSSTLATFLKYNLKPNSKSTVQAIMSPYGQELDKLAALERSNEAALMH